MTLLLASGCSKYDDSALNGHVGDLENRVDRLEEQCKQMNTDISSLQTLVEAIQGYDYVTGVTPVTQDGKEIGYTITFTKSAPITIYHGADGQDGAPGEDGQDGYTPQIGVKQDTDGVYYWTLDGEWMTDDSGNKIKAQGQDGQDGQNGTDGADGVTPQLKIENDYWYITYNGGSSWEQLGKATGEDGKDGADGQDGLDGDSFFQSVDTANSEYVIFTLADGTQIKLPTWYAFEQLRTLCNQMNTNMASLQSIVEALQNNDYIVSCTPLMEESVQIGYTITFAKSGSIVIYHGRDGVDGHSPKIGAKSDSDGVVYWTLDGKWLTDDSGSKIPVHGRDGQNGQNGQDGTDGADGVTPQLKIEDGYWYISYNGGSSWEQLGKATGEDGKDGADGQDGADGADGQDGDAFFSDVSQDEDYVYLTLSGGERIEVPKHHPLSVSFSETEDIRVLPNKTYTIDYTITGADENTVIKALAQDGFRAVVKETDFSKGVIEITTPETVLSTEILVFVTDGKERTIMRSINFVEGVILIATQSYTVDSEGGSVSIELSTNINYTVEIPEEGTSWISISGTETRVAMRDETVTLLIQPNENVTYRYSTIKFIDEQGVTGETVLITQKSGTSRVINVDTPGSLETIMSEDERNKTEDLKITGSLNSFDFEFIRTMPLLNTLDLRDTQIETLPASCLAETRMSTVILPASLKKISSRAFYGSAITSLYIPESVEEIGDYAFVNTSALTGNIVIPDNVTTIGNNAFQSSAFNGTLHIGASVQIIGEYAFSKCQGTGDIIIPGNVTSLGAYAFYQCTGFTGSLNIGSGVTIINEYTFSGCSGLKETLKFGNSITSIGEYAFDGCSSLTGNVNLPETLTEIDDCAFQNCTGFTGYLKIGPNVTSIGKWVFTKYEDFSRYKLNFSKIYCMAVTPPNIGSDTFGYFSRPEHLLVPIGCKETYENTNFGIYFTIIEETEF
jgi:hypothetical protein